MARIHTHRFDDIDQQVAFLARIAATTTYDDFASSMVMRYACQYSVLIIAEAVNNLPADLLAKHTNIEWRRIIAVGHKLRHEYHRVDPVVIWDIMTQHLEPLSRAIGVFRLVPAQ